MVAGVNTCGLSGLGGAVVYCGLGGLNTRGLAGWGLGWGLLGNPDGRGLAGWGLGLGISQISQHTTCKQGKPEPR